ncbi:hypothetical protein [Acidiphilium iwatense]|nr:hypothetical protein [Acidiphilium iwatense]
MIRRLFVIFALEPETLTIVENGELLKALLYVGLSVVFGFIGVFFGTYIACNL